MLSLLLVLSGAERTSGMPHSAMSLSVTEAQEMPGCPSEPGPVVIPEGITEIPEDAFRGCRNLESVTIPDSVTSIGDVSWPTCARTARPRRVWPCYTWRMLRFTLWTERLLWLL